MNFGGDFSDLKEEEHLDVALVWLKLVDPESSSSLQAI